MRFVAPPRRRRSPPREFLGYRLGGLAAVAGPGPTTAASVDEGPTEVGVVIDAARAKVAAGDAKGAIADLVPYVAQHPSDIAAGRLLGDIYFRIPDYAKAERRLAAIIAVAPDDRETHSRLGSLYAAQDRVNQAIDEFQKSLPSRSGYAGLIMAPKRAGDLPQYLNTLEYAPRRHPSTSSRGPDLGQARRALRQYEAAYQAFNHAVGIRPAACSPRIDMANVPGRPAPCRYCDRAPPRCAWRTTRTPIPRSSTSAKRISKRNDPAVARPYLDRALTIRPEGFEALVDIGYIYDLQGDWKTAVSYYNRAIRSDPLRPEAYIDLGYDYTSIASSRWLKQRS